MGDLLDKLQKKLNYRFNDLSLLERALTHSSMLGEQDDEKLSDLERGDYEQLEFIGDSVLELWVRAALLQEFSHREVGDLSKMADLLVSRATLVEVAGDLGVARFVRLGSAAPTQGRGYRRILADIVEALIGAVYLDASYDTAAAVLAPLYQSRIEALNKRALPLDIRGALDQRVQQLFGELPEYLVSECPDTGEDKRYNACVMLRGAVLGLSEGPTKKAATAAAARVAYFNIKDQAKSGAWSVE